MHEVDMTRCLLLSLAEWRDSQPSAPQEVRTVHLDVGEFTCVEPDALVTTYAAAVGGTWLERSSLAINSIPLVVLSNFLLISGLDYFLYATFFIGIVSGILLWLFGKPGIHLGASGLITGFWGLLVVDIYQQGTFTAIILGIISLYYFAGIFFGIFPTQKGVSWEGHLFGLVAGILFACLPTLTPYF